MAKTFFIDHDNIIDKKLLLLTTLNYEFFESAELKTLENELV